MQEFQIFYFEKYEFDRTSLKAKFFYSFDNIEFFEEIIDFNNSEFNLWQELDSEIIDNLLFHTHIALWISYYKLFPTKKLIVKSWFLDDNQIKFWQKFYRNWLWEFFIKNNFDFEDILRFENYPHPTSSLTGEELEQKNSPLLQRRGAGGEGEKSLLMWWWWKDSIVSSILLNEEWQEFDAFVFGKIDRIKSDTLKVLWKKTMLVKRQLSENLFKLNKAGYYNWHVPITWIIAFVSLISAYLYDYKNIVLSNEASACEENIIWKWLKINHQYSKSAEFENDFRKYVEHYIWNINYYSKLRDKFELEIAEIFAKKASKYFNTFSSCNRNFVILWEKQEKRWCCNCEKCAFVYLILGSFLEKKELLNIFWENLFENKNLLNTYSWLLGLTENKPYECVWTYDESRISFKNCLKYYKNKIKSWEIKKLPYILDNLEKEIYKWEKK